MSDRPTFTHSPDRSPAESTATAGSAGPASAVTPPTRADQYELGDEIARGGMGVVYRATDTALGREVAVKVLQERFAPDSGAARRFLDEGRITGQLQHPAIPPVHGVGTLPDGRPFLAMKLIKGRTLAEDLTDRPDPSHDRGRFLADFEKVCQAVGYAHAHRVIHRDPKPANVMVGNFGEVQVMDWGLAKVLRPPGGGPRPPAPTDETLGTEIRTTRGSDDLHTQAGSMLGTPAFMPPEQAGGELDRIDERSDVFGLGAMLCVILTGEPPYVGSDGEAVRLMAIRGKLADCLARPAPPHRRGR
jgi:serine/threonine protein kinase